MDLQVRNEPARYPRREYIHKAWRIQVDKHPIEDRWDWMIEEQNNGPVYWHQTVDEPTYGEIGEYIKAQDWS